MKRRTDAVIVASLLAASPAGAAVIDAAANGFTVEVTTQVAATPEKVYAMLITPSRWWSKEHTFSGKSSNLTLDAKAGGCWCETLPDGGSVMHLTVVYADPGKLLRLRGALGPFQAYALEGVMTWSLSAAGDGTQVLLEYALGGYSRHSLESSSKVVDGVLTEQVARLKKAIETAPPGR